MGGGTGISGVQLKSYNFTTGVVGDPLLLFSPVDLANQLAAMSRSIEGFSGLVNSLTYCPRGRTPSHGWFLTTRGEIADKLPRLLDNGREDIRLRFVERSESISLSGQGTGSGDTGYSNDSDFTVFNLLAIAAYAVTGIPETDITDADNDLESILESEGTNWRNQFYVVHVTDWRHIAQMCVATGAFNTRNHYWGGVSPSSTTDLVRTVSANWESALGTLWALLPTGEGDALDFSDATYPNSEPWNEKYWGVTAWDAFWSMLEQSNNTLVRNLAGSYFVKQLGSNGTDLGGTVSRTGSVTEQEDNEVDLISISNDLGGFNFPEKIRVIFPKCDYQWQTSGDANEVTPQDYWGNRPIWFKEINTADILGGVVDRTVPGSTHLIHSSTFAQFLPRTTTDFTESNGTPENDTYLGTEATDRATNYLNFLNLDAGILDKTYRGYIPFTPTHALSSILWGDGGSGPITRIMNLPLSQGGKEERVTSALGRNSLGGGGGSPSARYNPRESSSQRVSNEFPGAPDHARLSEPVTRWCVVELTEVCSPLAEAAGTVKFGIPTAADHDAAPGDQLIKWDGTHSIPASSKSIKVNNISKDVSAAIGDRVVAVWNEQIRKWLFCAYLTTSGTIVAGGVCGVVGGSDAIVGGAHATERYMDGYGYPAIAGYIHDACIDPAKYIRVNKDTHLSSFARSDAYGGGDCIYVATGGTAVPAEEMLISIDPSIDTGGSVFWSDGNKVRWTKAPHIGKQILLGDGKAANDPPRINFQHAEGAPSSLVLTDFYTIVCRAINTNLVTGSAPYINEIASMNQKVILPNDVATADFGPGQHLSVKSTGGEGDEECLKLRWTAQGLTANLAVVTSVNFGTSQANTRTLYFDDGILIGITQENSSAIDTGLAARTDPNDANCEMQTYTEPDPCAGAHAGDETHG